MNRYTLKFSALLNHTAYKYSFYFLIVAHDVAELLILCKEYFHDCQYSDRLYQLIKEHVSFAVVELCDDALPRVISYEVY